jgi:hypothetical protein
MELQAPVQLGHWRDNDGASYNEDAGMIIPIYTIRAIDHGLTYLGNAIKWELDNREFEVLCVSPEGSDYLSFKDYEVLCWKQAE